MSALSREGVNGSGADVVRATKMRVEPRRVFVCGPRKARIRKKCRFCDCRDAKSLCDWPMDKLKIHPAHEIRIGDTISIPVVDLQRAALFSVKAIRTFGPESEPYMFTFHVLLLRGCPQARRIVDRIMRSGFTRSRNADVYRREKATCDKACCYRHRIHVGPGRDYCMDHWADIKNGIEVF